MADRTQAYFRQLVDSVFFTSGHDGLEDADRNFAVDIGAIGIISGLVATQHAPTPDLTIDLTGPGTAYDQAGRRMFVPTATSGLDCSQDEDGNPTAVTTPGNERWCSVQLRFDRTLASPEVDGNGVTVYTDQDESFELAVVRAGEFAIGTNTKPALPADGRLICDFRLINGQTQIFTVGDIYTDRRQDFQIFSGAQIPISSGGWTFLSPATDDVQATFDFIDARILYLDASREMTENLVPDAAARDLGAVGQEWDLFLETLTPSASSRVDGNLIPKITGNDLGTASLRWSAFADLVNLDGNLVTSASSRVLGNLIPSAGTEALGSAALRWAAFTNTITHYGALKGTVNFDSAKQIVVRLPLGSVIPSGNWAFSAIYYQNTTSTESLYYYFTVPEDVSLDDVRIRWYEDTSANMAASIESLDEDNTPSTVAGPTTIGGFGANRWDSIGGGSLAEVIDRTTTTYRVKVVTGSTNTQRVLGLELTFDITDILAASLGSC